MELDLRGRTALVTGSSKGIGRAVAEILAGEGCNLYLAARTLEDLESTAQDIRTRHQVSVTVHAFDLSLSDDINALADACPDIDILVNNAGSIPGATLETLGEEEWRKAWDLKVFGYINLCRRVYAAMKERGHGVIVNIIGAGGERPTFTYIAGGAANAGLMAFTKALGSESRSDGIRVVAINPGAIATDRLKQLRRQFAELQGNDPEAALDDDPVLSRAGKPEDIAYATAFLASDRAAYISGTVLTVAGGGP